MNPFHGTDRPHDPPQHPSSTDASGLRHLSADLSPVVDHPHADEHPSPHVDLPNAVDHPTTPPSSTETRSQPRQDTGFTIPIDVIAENGEWTSNVKKQWDGFRLERVEERSPVPGYRLTQIDGRELWAPPDLDQLRPHHFLQGQTPLSVEFDAKGTCWPGSTIVAAGIYLDPERRNPHFSDEAFIVAAGLRAGDLRLERFQREDELKDVGTSLASMWRENYDRLRSGADAINVLNRIDYLPEQTRLAHAPHVDAEIARLLGEITPDSLLTRLSHTVSGAKRREIRELEHEMRQTAEEIRNLASELSDERWHLSGLYNSMAHDMQKLVGIFSPHQFLQDQELPARSIPHTTAELASHPGKVALVGVDSQVFWHDSPYDPRSFKEDDHAAVSLGPAYERGGAFAGLLFHDTGAPADLGACVFKPRSTCEKAIDPIAIIKPSLPATLINQIRPGFPTS